METRPTQPHGTAASTRSFDLDALGLGPPTRVRRRGKVDKWTRLLGVAVVLLLVFYLGVRLGHGSRPQAAGPGSGAPGTATGGGSTAGGGSGAGPAKAASGTVKVVDGTALYVTQPDGTTKKVVADDSTRFTRTVPAGLRDIQPGDRVTVEGQVEPDGTVDAVRVDGEAATLQQR